MGAFGPGKRRRSDRECGRVQTIPRLRLNLYTKVPQEVDAGPPMIPPAPVLPEERSRTDDHRMEQYADLAWFRLRTAIALARLSERAGTTTTNAGSIHHAQAVINTITSPKQAFMRQESKLAKLCVSLSIND